VFGVYTAFIVHYIHELYTYTDSELHATTDCLRLPRRVAAAAVAH